MALRDMPDPVADAIAAFCTARGIAVARPTEAADITGLAAQVRAARLVVSTDTAMVHLADAMAVPCVAFFPTHDPAWRVRDYPLCTAVRLESGLPPALEFARGEADVAAAYAAWFRPGVDWIEPVLSAALDLSALLPSPRPSPARGEGEAMLLPLPLRGRAGVRGSRQKDS